MERIMNLVDKVRKFMSRTFWYWWFFAFIVIVYLILTSPSVHWVFTAHP